MDYPIKFVLFLLICSSYSSLGEDLDETNDPSSTTTPQMETMEELPTFEALVDLMKPDEDTPELSKDAKRVEKLTQFLTKFRLSVDKVNYQARRFKETIQNRGQNYQDMKQLLKDIYHKVMQDTLDKYGLSS